MERPKSSSAEFKKIMSNASVAGPASESLIQAAENRLSLRFPPEYRRFLKEYGAAGVDGYHIAGIFIHEDSEPPLWQDVVTATELFREAAKGMLPDTLVSIANDGRDVAYYIDVTHQDESGCVCIAWGPGVEGETVARSLEEFVVKLAKDELVV